MNSEVMRDYFPEKKVALDLGVTILTLRNWSAKRQGPPRVKVARKIYYHKEGMAQWLLFQEKRQENALTTAGAMPVHAAGNGRAAANGHAAVNGRG